jgi:D-alanyl-D-alanine carboxypeptidase (penicillin-binding protein 5/6)
MLLCAMGQVVARDVVPERSPAPASSAAIAPAKKAAAPQKKPGPPPPVLIDPAQLVGVPPPLSAQAAILLDLRSGQVLWEHNAQRRMYPASLTKMMTALLAIESRRLDDTFRASKLAAATGESTIYLQEGEPLRLRQVLQAVLIVSANDAAVMMAESVGGSVPAFAQMMNERAVAMGLRDTHFVNPSGLHDENHYSTAADLAQIARRGMLNDVFARIVATKATTIPWAVMPLAKKASMTPASARAQPAHPPVRKLVNRNRLLSRWDKCDGVKTGFTHPAGRCLAATATIDGWQLLSVVLKSVDSWTDAQNLLQWGYANFRRQRVAATRDIHEVPVQRGARRLVQARAQDDLYVVVSPQETAAAAVLVPEPCEAPVEIGQRVGKLRASNGATVALVALEAVPRSLWARLCDMGLCQWAAVLMALVAAGVLLHGASAKTARARRRRLQARQREADLAGASNGQRAAGPTGD